MVPKEICWSKLAPLWRARYTKISLFVFNFLTTSNGGALVYPRQRKLVRSSTFRREFIPFVGLILIVLAILAYYLGKTQYITIRGKHRKVWVQKKNSLFPEFGFTRQSLEIVIEKNGKLKLNWAATSIKRLRLPFGRGKIQSKIDGDDDCGPVILLQSCLFFFFKVMFLLKIMLIYDKRLAGTLRVAA